MSILSHEGLKGMKKFSSFGVISIILILIFIVVFYSPQINFENFYYNDFSNVFFPFGVILFSLLGLSGIAEVKRVSKGSEKNFKKIIILGVLIPAVVYLFFGSVFLGVLGKSVQEVATLSFGKPVIVFGIFTMMTCYFVLNFALRDIFTLDLKLSKTNSFILSSVLPLILYVLCVCFLIWHIL
jgi:amino acid transporter